MTNSTDTYYYFSDGLGSVRNVVESDEDVANTYDYRAYGDNLAATENVTSPYRFTGREYESGGVLNMHYYRNRYYLPTLGLFASRDAMWADVHRGWGYVGNMPTEFLDPWGLNANRDLILERLSDPTISEAQRKKWRKHLMLLDAANEMRDELEDVAYWDGFTSGASDGAYKYYESLLDSVTPDSLWEPDFSCYMENPDDRILEFSGKMGDFMGDWLKIGAFSAVGHHAGLQGKFKVNGRGGEPTHVGVDWRGKNLIHYGRHAKWGRHLGVGWKGPLGHARWHLP